MDDLDQQLARAAAIERTRHVDVAWAQELVEQLSRRLRWQRKLLWATSGLFVAVAIGISALLLLTSLGPVNPISESFEQIHLRFSTVTSALQSLPVEVSLAAALATMSALFMAELEA